MTDTVSPTVLQTTHPHIAAIDPLTTVLVPMPVTAERGMTGQALRTAGATITKMHIQAIALRNALTAANKQIAELERQLAELRQVAH